MKRVRETLAQDLLERGKLDLSETFIDGTFIVAKKGASKLERPSGHIFSKAGNAFMKIL